MSTAPGPNALKQTDWIIQRITGQTLTEWLTERRGAGESYQSIADDLHMLTDGVVEVSREWVRRYANELGIEEDAA